MQITAELDYNYSDIYSVIDELFDDVSDDLSDVEELVVDEKHIWIKVTVDGELAGYYWLHPYTNSVMQIHVNVLKPFRKYKDEIKETVQVEILKHLPDHIDQLISVIPEIYPNVLAYSLSCGFKLKGCIREVYLKNGTYWDYDIVGITVEEFKSQVTE